MSRSRMLVAGVGLALVAAVVIFVWSAGDVPERVPAAATPGPSTPGPSDPPAPVPADPKGERWRWDHAPVVNVAAAGHGVVAATDKGAFVGIDGTTGRQLWEQQGGENILDVAPKLEVAPGGATVITWVGDTIFVQGLEAFDAFTGRPLWQADHATGFAGVAVTESTVILGQVTDSPAVLSALAVDTGKEVWRYPAPAGCTFQGTAGEPPLTASDDTVFVQINCDMPTFEGDHADVLALDAATGAELWQRQISGSPEWRAAQPIGGGAVALKIRNPHATPPESTVAVDQRTGQDLSVGGPDLGYVVAAGPDSLEVITTEGVHRIGDPAPRWRYPANLKHVPVPFGHIVAVYAVGCGGLELMLYELDSGVQRRSLGCLEAAGIAVAAPGALVVTQNKALVGYA